MVCYSDGCEKPHLTDGWYCGDHECTEPNCYQERVKDVRFCAAHKCPGCSSRCRENGLYCNECRCNFNNDCADIRVTNSANCAKHTCGISWCFQTAHFVSGFCNNHTCNWNWRCDEKRCRLALANFGATHAWCNQHTCYEPGCTEGRQSDLGLYCVGHTCSRNQCWERTNAMNGSEFKEHTRRDLVPAASQDYRGGFMDGFGFGINLDPVDQDAARRILREANRAMNQRGGREAGNIGNSNSHRGFIEYPIS